MRPGSGQWSSEGGGMGSGVQALDLPESQLANRVPLWASVYTFIGGEAGGSGLSGPRGGLVEGRLSEATLAADWVLPPLPDAGAPCPALACPPLGWLRGVLGPAQSLAHGDHTATASPTERWLGPRSPDDPPPPRCRGGYQGGGAWLVIPQTGPAWAPRVSRSPKAKRDPGRGNRVGGPDSLQGSHAHASVIGQRPLPVPPGRAQAQG